MIVLISAVVALSAVLPAAVSLLRVRAILRTKTFEICRNLGNHISNLAREELLLDETYDATFDAMRRLASSQDSDDRIPGLLDSYVVNFDGSIVAAVMANSVGRHVSDEDLSYFRTLEILALSEGRHSQNETQTLRFSYPVFVRAFDGQRMRVGTTVFLFDRNEVYRPVQDLTTFIVVATVGLLAVGLVVAILTALYFARPIQVLTEGANRIGSGDLGHRIEVLRSDELGALALNFNRMTGEIQDFTRNLEEKVKDRTRKLNRSLEEIRELKEQQDGDYFLTSLLLEPFRRNENLHPDTKTDFIIDQKKKFSFRDWTAEIGGDYCFTDTIAIGNLDYTVFLNADAMGKSIQGAGGALVLATVFQAFLARTRDERHSYQRPELWLRDCYLALQNIFVTFRGTMFITMVMGLADRSGAVYFVNAEHPPCALFRAGRASYVEQGLWLRKLGTPGEQGNFRIRMLQLEPGDVLFVGSDGKDDITPNTAGKAVAADGDWFLRHLELTDGALEPMLAALRQNGEVKDDISILRLTFRPGGPESRGGRSDLGAVSGTQRKGVSALHQELFALALAGDLPEERVGAALARAEDLAAAGKRSEARTLYLAALLARPTEDAILLQLANLSLRLRDLARAEDYAECLRLRDPHNEDAVVLLAEVYLRRGDMERAELSVERAIELAPDRADVHRLFREVGRKVKRVGTAEEIVETAELDRLRANVERQFSEGNYLPAAAVCRQLLALLPDDAHAQERMGDSFLRAEKYERAIPLYNRVLFGAPKNSVARNNVAVAHWALGHDQVALAHLRKASTSHPRPAVVEQNLARVKQALQKTVGRKTGPKRAVLAPAESQGLR